MNYEWIILIDFFSEAGISSSAASNYASIFLDQIRDRIKLDLSHEVLKEIGIQSMEDVTKILKHKERLITKKTVSLEASINIALTPAESMYQEKRSFFDCQERRECALQRLRSFRYQTLESFQLASAGFYCVDLSNYVIKCAFCEVKFSCYGIDDPIRDHKAWSPMCKFVQNLPCGNVPMDMEVTARIPTSIESVGEQHKCPDFATYEERMKSYQHWPISLSVKPNVLCEAGLFYLGLGDHVACYHCGVVLKDWSDGDKPFNEHGRRSPWCTVVRSILLKKYADSIKTGVPKKVRGYKGVTGECVKLFKSILLFFRPMSQKKLF